MTWYVSSIRRFAVAATLFVAGSGVSFADFNFEFDTTGDLANNFTWFGLNMFPDFFIDPTSFSHEFGAPADFHEYGDGYITANNSPPGETFGSSRFDLNETAVNGGDVGAVEMIVSGGQDGHFQFHRLIANETFDITQGATMDISVGDLDGQFFVSVPRNSLVIGYDFPDGSPNPDISIQIGVDDAFASSLIIAEAGGSALPGGSAGTDINGNPIPLNPDMSVSGEDVGLTFNIDDDSYSLSVYGVPIIPDTLHGLSLTPGEFGKPFFEARRVFGTGETNFTVNQFGVAVAVDMFDEADFDRDGDVDGDDFLAWQGGFGTASGASKADGDYDNDGDVDGDDFLGWQSEFGSSGSGSGAVPEPAAAVSLLLFGAAMLAGRWRRSSRRTG